jgi:hypothetical protein
MLFCAGNTSKYALLGHGRPTVDGKKQSGNGYKMIWIDFLCMLHSIVCSCLVQIDGGSILIHNIKTHGA